MDTRRGKSCSFLTSPPHLSFFSVFLLSLFLLSSFLLPTIDAYSIEIEPAASECFIVTADQVGSPLSGSFEVISTNPKPIVVTVKGPSPKHVLHFESKYNGEEEEEAEKILSEGSFSFDSEQAGDYTMCITNGDEENNDGNGVSFFLFISILEF